MGWGRSRRWETLREGGGFFSFSSVKGGGLGALVRLVTMRGGWETCDDSCCGGGWWVLQQRMVGEVGWTGERGRAGMGPHFCTWLPLCLQFRLSRQTSGGCAAVVGTNCLSRVVLVCSGWNGLEGAGRLLLGDVFYLADAGKLVKASRKSFTLDVVKRFPISSVPTVRSGRYAL